MDLNSLSLNRQLSSTPFLYFSPSTSSIRLILSLPSTLSLFLCIFFFSISQTLFDTKLLFDSYLLFIEDTDLEGALGG